MRKVMLGKYGLLLGGAFFLVGCAAPRFVYTVSEPVPSAMKFESAKPAGEGFALSFVDSRDRAKSAFATGVMPITINLGPQALDPATFLRQHLQVELASRGVPVAVGGSAGSGPTIRLNAFQLENHRTSAYSPFVTFTSLSADLEWAGRKERVAAYVKRGKLVMWSLEEIIEPAYNQPLALVVRELAAKIAGRLYGAQSPDGAVEALAAKLAGKRSEDSFLDVYALGFTNNPKAVPLLVRLASDPDEYVRLAAISSLGTLRAVAQFDFLKSIYEGQTTLWQDRGMALKALGDLGTPESQAYLKAEESRWASAPASKEAIWNLQIIRLYTQSTGNSFARGRDDSLGDLINEAPVASVPAPKLVPARPATPVATAPAAANPRASWKYAYQDQFGKRSAAKVTARSWGGDSVLEEWSVEDGGVETLRWSPNGPLLRSQTVAGTEWVNVSPLAFDDEGPLRSFLATRRINVFGQEYQAEVRQLGRETISAAGERLDTVKIEILGKNPVSASTANFLVGSTIQSFGVQVWYSKELKRIVKLSFWSRGVAAGAADKYEILLQGRS